MNPLSLYSHLKICPSSFLFENFLVAEASNIDISSNVGDGEGKKWKWGDIEKSQKSAPSNCYFCRLLSTSTLTAEEEWCLIWVYFPCVCDFFSWRLLFNSNCPKYVCAAKEQSESVEVNVLSKLCQRRNWCLVKVSPSWLHHQPAYIFHGCELRPLRIRNLECRLLFDALPSADPMQCTRSWPLVSVDRKLVPSKAELGRTKLGSIWSPGAVCWTTVQNVHRLHQSPAGQHPDTFQSLQSTFWYLTLTARVKREFVLMTNHQPTHRQGTKWAGKAWP